MGKGMTQKKNAKQPAATVFAADRDCRLFRKTYAVPGLMELKMTLRTGRSLIPTVEVLFEGGQITGYGMSPAKYTTEDPVIQRLIEENRWFKCGRIRLMETEALSDV